MRELIRLSEEEKEDRESKRQGKMTKAEREDAIRKLEKEMREASKRLEFEYAAVLRDRIIELRGQS